MPSWIHIFAPRRSFLLSCLARTLLLTLVGPLQAADGNPAIRKANAYLLRESLAWPEENHCFSCHNNGDATRAVLLSSNSPQITSKALSPKAIAWLEAPEQWSKTGPAEGDFAPSLALIQFGITLEIARAQGRVQASPETLNRLGLLLTKAQHPLGYWPIESPHHLGSPGTYGNILGTAMACRVLASLNTPEAREAIERSRSWIRTQELKATVELAGGIMLLNRHPDPQAQRQARQWATDLISHQNPNGSWGPYRHQFGEVFDTAIAVIALAETNSTDNYRRQLTEGQSFLMKQQEPEGGWPETTRPPGGVSYAQHVSTSAWALIALTHLEPVLNPTAPQPDLLPE